MTNQSIQNLPSIGERVESATLGIAKEGGEGSIAPQASDLNWTAAGGPDSGGVLTRELWLRRQARHAISIAADLDDADALLIPLVLSLARLCAQRDAREQGQGALLESGKV